MGAFGFNLQRLRGNAIISDMLKKDSYVLLDTIKKIGDVRKLKKEQLKILSEELRCFLIDTVSAVGGHFGSNLGVVELTVALHYLYNPEKDRLIWDVGHQAYAHKVLTGRKSRLHSIKKKDGLAPFPKRRESVSDAFGTGHASTSISAGLGMSSAHQGESGAPAVVAIIGDGALSGGMAFEALNHAGDIGANILVILNDNKMSISPNVGAMTRYLTRLISSPEYLDVREKGKNILENIPMFQEVARRVERHAKGMITPGTIFEEMGFSYFGPVDGHDISVLVDILGNLKRLKGPRLLHIMTQKGKGCIYAERDTLALHAVSSFDPITGKKNEKSDGSKTYTDIFSSWIVSQAEREKNLHAITPAMMEGSGLAEFQKKFPKRFHDVGIAEQHCVTFAAGLACEGKKPVVAIYSTFLQRAYDQVIHDVAIQNLDVLFAIDRGGIVGPDGETHAGNFDLSFLRCVPNMVVMAPSDAGECVAMLEFGFVYEGPVAVRYPRATAPERKRKKDDKIILGKAKIVRKGNRIAILSFGALLDRCEKVAKELNATLVDMRFIKPIDEGILRKLAKTHTNFVTVEDNTVIGGAGSAVDEFFMRNNLGARVCNIGLPDRFLSHGTRDEVLAEAELSTEKILKRIQECFCLDQK